MKKLISINPANQQVVGEISFTTNKEMLEKIQAAHAIKSQWKNIGAKKRVEILRPLISLFKHHATQLALLTTQEIGKPITEAMDDLHSDFEYFEYFLNEGPQYIEDEITVKNNNTIHRIVYEPRGVVACISPWNYPFSNFLWAVIPNLIVGNVVIFKHSEECPMIGKLIEDIMISLPDLPKGVFAEVYGNSETGEDLIKQDINMIWFTGSSTTGIKIFELAAKKHIKSVLEMGGSNPAILFDDADVDSVIPKIYRGRFTNCGQSCDAIKRLIVHKNRYNEVIEKLSQYLGSIEIGNPENNSTELGPLVSMRQLILLESQVQDAVNQGANIVFGGKRPNNTTGSYYLPTLLINIKKSMRVWKEEVFGPVLPIIPFETEAQAVKLANESIFGLGASVYSADLERARRIANNIEAGSININNGSRWEPCNPFGGYKISGKGCTHGKLGFQELCQFKIIAEA